MHTFESLAKVDKKTLEKIMKEGVLPDVFSMWDWEFDGYNLTPLASILGIRKFRKGFYQRYGVKGYNVRMKQNKFEEPWEYKGDKPERFGWFDVLEYEASLMIEEKHLYKKALLLNYGLDKRNSLFEGKMLRDFLVQVNKGDKDLYLGKAYNAVGKRRIMPSYFILKRAEKVEL